MFYVYSPLTDDFAFYLYACVLVKLCAGEARNDQAADPNPIRVWSRV